MRLTLTLILIAIFGSAAMAQDIRVATVERPPFVMTEESGALTGFSIDLWEALAEDINRGYEMDVHPDFTTMLGHVEAGTADAAIANISITAEREQVMDFSQPIFASGLQIMTMAKRRQRPPFYAPSYRPTC